MKRKYKNYTIGDTVHSLGELCQQEFVFWIPAPNQETLVHRGWFMSWQLFYAERQISSGRIFKAIRKAVRNEP